jgi:aryl-alcohol dehydrogenase-like predicted oxidoreductase
LAAALLPTAAALGIPFVTWGSLAQGLLTGKYSSASTFGADDHRHRYTSFHGERFRRNLDGVAQLSAVAQRLGATPAQVAIRWLLDAPNVACVLVGAKRVGQVDDNAQAMAVQLPPPERQLLEAAATGPSAAEPAVRAVGRDAA